MLELFKKKKKLFLMSRKEREKKWQAYAPTLVTTCNVNGLDIPAIDRI